MNTKVNHLLAGIIFVLCMGAGFFITKALNDNSESNEIKIDTIIGVKDPDTLGTIGEPVPRDNQKVTTPVQEPVESIKITSTAVKKRGNSYSLQIICTNVPVNVTLQYEIPDLQMKNTDGYFTQIPGRKSGRYKVNVRDSSTNEVLAWKDVSGFELIEETPVTVKSMSAGEFQALLLNQSDNSLLGGKHPKVGKSISLSFVGLRDGEKKPGDILSVREKIAYGIWSSAKVLSVGYDERGKINSARIQPIYLN